MIRSLTLIATMLLGAATTQAAQLPSPTGPVILTISGNISNTNGDAVAEFDLAMLDALAQRTTNAKTPWFDAETSFSGPLGKAILDYVGATGDTLRVIALNDYASDIPTGDFRELDTILATRIDDRPLSVRDKGPLFVIYPFDSDPSLLNEVYFSRSVWQVSRIEVQ